MFLEIQKAGKHYQYKWVYRNLSLRANKGEKIAIIGQNGSGKSTLLKAIAGLESLDEGKIAYQNQQVMADKNYSFCAPYTAIIEDFSTLENLEFAKTFKPWRNQMTSLEVAMLLPEDKRNFEKPIKLLSSGMIQRVKLLLAIMANVPLVCLDEPLSNLDDEGMQWYHQLVETYLTETLVFVAGNNSNEFSFCSEVINLEGFK